MPNIDRYKKPVKGGQENERVLWKERRHIKDTEWKRL